MIMIRLDKIGDLVCSLPADQIIDDNAYDVTWIVQKGMGAIVDLGTRSRKYFELDKNDPAESAARLAEILTELKPEIAVSFQAPWWISFELFKARVPLRSGVRSQWHSFLFLNDGLRQKRSSAAQHELDYNLDLVRHTLRLKQTREFLYFEIQPPISIATLEMHRLVSKKYIVVHPGMMGSALNWKQSQYIAFIHGQLAKKKHVVITGTASDESYLTEIKKEFADHPQILFLQSKLNLPELIEVLYNSEFVVAPSTGVAHLAASVGARVFGIYSPIRVHHPRRWAARGPDVQIYLPPVDCPATHKCHGRACPYFNCMDRIIISVN